MANTASAPRTSSSGRLEFDRARPVLGSSLARWRHRKDTAEIINQLWVTVLEKDALLQQIKPIAGEDGPPASVLKVKSDANGKVGHNIAELRSRMNSTYSFERLFTLLMAVSALERYMLAVATAAIESDPLRTSGFPKLLDGLVLKKRKIEITKPSLTPIVKGEWSGRIATLERLFGSVPDKLKDAQGELERIRQTRNAIAHNLGSEGDDNGTLPPSLSLIVGARADRLLMPRRGLSQNRLVSWLRLLTDVSIALDSQFTTQYIGDYEAAAIYLDWRDSPDRYEKALGITLVSAKKSHSQRFQNFASSALDMALGSSYVQGLERYISRL